MPKLGPFFTVKFLNEGQAMEVQWCYFYYEKREWENR